MKADVPKGSVLQKNCCTKNYDEKVFIGRQEELCINIRDNEQIPTCVFYMGTFTHSHMTFSMCQWRKLESPRSITICEKKGVLRPKLFKFIFER